MNFLAHLYLSGTDEDLLTGNFIADFVKGKTAPDRYPEPVTRGIRLHRAIDLFTDTHPVVGRSKGRLRERYRHYSGVIVDVFYDYFLAVNWANYHNTPLTDYAAYIYNLLNSRFEDLPPGVQQMLPYMIRGNWLVSYATTEGIHRALSGMARRTTFPSGMEEAIRELYQHQELFQSEFQEFFPELREHCREFLVAANKNSV